MHNYMNNHRISIIIAEIEKEYYQIVDSIRTAAHDVFPFQLSLTYVLIYFLQIIDLKYIETNNIFHNCYLLIINLVMLTVVCTFCLANILTKRYISIELAE